MISRHRKHQRAVWALFVATGIVAMFIAFQAAYGAPVPEAPIQAVVVAFPPVPDAPILDAGEALCENGVNYRKVEYDTDIGGPGATLFFTRLDTNTVFVVIVYSAEHPAGKAWVRQDGAVVTMTVMELVDKSPSPCTLLTGQTS